MLNFAKCRLYIKYNNFSFYIEIKTILKMKDSSNKYALIAIVYLDIIWSIRNKGWPQHWWLEGELISCITLLYWSSYTCLLTQVGAEWPLATFGECCDGQQRINTAKHSYRIKTLKYNHPSVLSCDPHSHTYTIHYIIHHCFTNII
jgi:hypothetical protein